MRDVNWQSNSIKAGVGTICIVRLKAYMNASPKLDTFGEASSNMLNLTKRQILHVNPEKCIGCGLCEMACSWEKEKEFNPMKSRIRVVHMHPFINLATTCRQCEDVSCVKACPRNALVQSGKTGAILVDDEKCDGCKWCIEACRYGTVRYDPEKTTVLICDLCEGDPKCLKSCPEEALGLVDSEEEMKKIWSETAQKWVLESQKLISMFTKGDSDLFENAEQITERVEKKVRELFENRI